MKIGEGIQDVILNCHKPYRSHLMAKTYTKGTDITVQDVSGTDDTLTVDTAKVVPFYIDDLDKIQNKWDMATKFAGDAQRLLNNVLDQAVLAEYSSATSDIYNADVGGSGSTTAIPITTANIFNVFTAAARKLDYLNMPSIGRFATLSPRALETLRLSIAGRETGVGDTVGENGKIGNRFGFELYETNNAPFTATFTIGDTSTPDAADTVSIAGVTFTWRTDTADAAGEVYATTNSSTSLDNLVLAINGTTAGTSTTYYALSDANRWKLTNAGVTATRTTASIMTITAYGDVVVASSDAADLWSVQIQHLLFGIKGATDLVVQKSPSVEFRVAEKRLGRYVYPWMLYGKKTFGDGADALVDVNIDASSWV